MITDGPYYGEDDGFRPSGYGQNRYVETTYPVRAWHVGCAVLLVLCGAAVVLPVLGYAILWLLLV